jgi:hypothetical protein
MVMLFIKHQNQLLVHAKCHFPYKPIYIYKMICAISKCWIPASLRWGQPSPPWALSPWPLAWLSSIPRHIYMHQHQNPHPDHHKTNDDQLLCTILLLHVHEVRGSTIHRLIPLRSSSYIQTRVCVGSYTVVLLMTSLELYHDARMTIKNLFQDNKEPCAIF